jgi:PadR family transcriptional regulator PadR
MMSSDPTTTPPRQRQNGHEWRRTRRVVSDSDIERRGREVSPVKELLRGAVRLHILHHAADEPVHGAWMSAELASHGYAISPGTLYPTLHRMQEEGLLTSTTEVIGGRTRRVYRATDAGLTALAEARRAVAELAAEVLPPSSEEESS